MSLDLDAIVARYNAATPGSWGWNVEDGYLVTTALRDDNGEHRVVLAAFPEHNADAPFIAHSRTDIPALVARVRELEAQIAAVMAIHTPHSIYDECDHRHATGEPGVVNLSDVGLTCAKMYDICAACCTDASGEQSEGCVSEHQHGPDLPICQTLAALHAYGWKESEN